MSALTVTLGADIIALKNCHDLASKKSGGKVVRVNPRFPESTAKRLKEASAIRGQSVAAFVLEVVSREADEYNHHTNRTLLWMSVIMKSAAGLR